MGPIGPQFAKGRTADIFGWGAREVLKLYRHGFTLATAEREADLTRLAKAGGVRTPEVIDVVSLDGRAGVIFERIDGPTMLQALSESPENAVELARSMATLHADMHGRRDSTLPVLHEYLRKTIGAGRGLPEETKAAVLATLATLPDGEAICHGDFHPANIILSADGPVIIDWFHATRGHPHADVANTILVFTHAVLSRQVEPRVSMRIRAVRAAFCAAYLQRYAEIRPVAEKQLMAWRVPVAAAGLSEHVPDAQRKMLVSLIQRMITGG